jgi:hypothetical protein
MKTDRQDIVLLCFITLIGLFIRISPALSASFPLNDGGLFYKMILDLQENHFELPMFTSYNNANIPFVYPPLAFYAYAIASNLSDIPVLILMRFGPAIVSGLSIPAFFLLARELLDTKQQVFLSVAIFTLVPRAFDWLIMGGGITRSLGLLFALLTIRQVLLMFSSPSIKNLVWVTLWSGLVISTHPEAAIHTLIASILVYFWKDRTRMGLIRAGIIAAGAALITTPWWAAAITRHGIDPFIAVLSSANQDSNNLIVRLLGLFRFDFTDEPFLTLVSVFGLIGLFAMLAQKKTAMPVWFLLIQIIEPRGGPLYMMLPLSMFAGFALDQVILPMLKAPPVSNTGRSMLRPNLEKTFISFIFLYGMLSATIVTMKISQELTLTSADLKAFTWAREHTPNASRFILITQADPLNDATSEWFPAIAGRTSMVTVFGREWINDGGFAGNMQNYRDLQKCMLEGMTCLNNWIKETGTDFTHIYIRKIQGKSTNPAILSEELGRASDYQALYKSKEIDIFEKK